MMKAEVFFFSLILKSERNWPQGPSFNEHWPALRTSFLLAGSHPPSSCLPLLPLRGAEGRMWKCGACWGGVMGLSAKILSARCGASWRSGLFYSPDSGELANWMVSSISCRSWTSGQSRMVKKSSLNSAIETGQQKLWAFGWALRL